MNGVVAMAASESRVVRFAPVAASRGSPGRSGDAARADDRPVGAGFGVADRERRAAERGLTAPRAPRATSGAFEEVGVEIAGPHASIG